MAKDNNGYLRNRKLSHLKKLSAVEIAFLNGLLTGMKIFSGFNVKPGLLGMVILEVCLLYGLAVCWHYLSLDRSSSLLQ